MSKTNKNKNRKSQTDSNPFQLFVLNFQQNEEESKLISMTFEEAKTKALPIWNNNKHTREEYLERFKSIDDVSAEINRKIEKDKLKFQERLRREKSAVQVMMQEINDILDSVACTKHIWIFFSVACFRTDDQKGYPGELAVLKYSVDSGIKDVLHMRINPGELPAGASAEALTSSKETHQLPIPPELEGEQSWIRISEKLDAFIGTYQSIYRPILFVDPGVKSRDFEDARKTLNRFNLELEYSEKYRLCGLDELFLRLQKKAAEYNGRKPFESIGMARLELSKNKFIYSTELGCDFHREKDNLFFCSLSRVQRWACQLNSHCWHLIESNSDGNSDVTLNENHKLDAKVEDFVSESKSNGKNEAECDNSLKEETQISENGNNSSCGFVSNIKIDPKTNPFAENYLGNKTSPFDFEFALSYEN